MIAFLKLASMAWVVYLTGWGGWAPNWLYLASVWYFVGVLILDRVVRKFGDEKPPHPSTDLREVYRREDPKPAELQRLEEMRAPKPRPRTATERDERFMAGCGWLES